MFKNVLWTRYNILGAILLLFMGPVVLLSAYGMLAGSNAVGWDIFGLGLLLGIAGSIALFLMMREWEQALQKAAAKGLTLELAAAGIPPKEREPALQAIGASGYSSDSIEEDSKVKELESRARAAEESLSAAEDNLRKCEENLSAAAQSEAALQREVTRKTDELIDLAKEKERFQRQSEEILREFNHYREAAEEKLEQTRLFLGEYQQTINEQRNIIESKQQAIGQLESKVRDLTYEIKTLLQLAETARTSEQTPAGFQAEPSLALREAPAAYGAEAEEEGVENEPPSDRRIATPEEAAVQLKRCIDIAQKMTGANYYTPRYSRLKDLSMDNFTLDLRCLFDSLRSENSSTVMVYSPKESKVLFVNSQVKGLLGWNTEKFLQNFQEIILESEEAWKGLLAQLAYKNEVQAQLLMKSKTGQSVPVACHLGMVPTGIFRGSIIGVLFI